MFAMRRQNVVFHPLAGIFKCMFPFHCITERIRAADHELFKRPCYLLIILCSTFSSMTTAVKSHREREVIVYVNRARVYTALTVKTLYLDLFHNFQQLSIITKPRMFHTLFNRLANTKDTPSNSVRVS